MTTRTRRRGPPQRLHSTPRESPQPDGSAGARYARARGRTNIAAATVTRNRFFCMILNVFELKCTLMRARTTARRESAYRAETSAVAEGHPPTRLLTSIPTPSPPRPSTRQGVPATP